MLSDTNICRKDMVTPDPSKVWPPLACIFLQFRAFFSMKVATVMGHRYDGLNLHCMYVLYVYSLYLGMGRSPRI